MAKASKISSSSAGGFAALLEKSGYKISRIRRNQEVTGTVVSVSPTELMVDIGAKSEGVVSGRELSAVSDLVSKLSPGDKIDATVIFQENDAGQVVLSLRKLSGEKRWEELEEKKDNEEEIVVEAIEANRGGVVCDYFGLRGFLPANELAKTSKASGLIGKSLTVKVLEVDRNGNRIILSQKRPDAKELEEIKKQLAQVEIGQKLPGVVTAVLPFGLFVEVDAGKEGKLEGLVHVSEVAWEKTDDLSLMYKVGDKAEIIVVSKDEQSGRLALSIRQLLKDPFVESSAKFNKEEKITGTVAKVTPYGVYVTLEDGLEGMIHISKIPPNVSFNVGQSVDCNVDSVDAKNRKIALAPVVLEKPVLYR